jgi:hypothetical protein
VRRRKLKEKKLNNKTCKQEELIGYWRKLRRTLIILGSLPARNAIARIPYTSKCRLEVLMSL